MEVITGQKKMDASALIDYFEPLVDWLRTENKNKNYSIGWESACPVSQIPNQVRSEQDRAKTWLEEYNNLAEKAMYKEYEAEWTYTSNITDENQAKQVSLTGL
jgi:peptidyl-dipeptidase A